jgi:hypothetical protein
VLGAVLLKKLPFTGWFAKQGFNSAKKFFTSFAGPAEAAAAAEGTVAGRTFAGAFDKSAAEGLAGGGAAAGAGGGLLAGGVLGQALKKLGGGIVSTLKDAIEKGGSLLGKAGKFGKFGGGVVSATIGALLFPDSTSTAPGEGTGGGKFAPGTLGGNTFTNTKGGFTPAKGTDYSHGRSRF